MSIQVVYAIVKAGGRQEKVSVGDVVVVDKLAGEIGDEVTLAPVMLVDGDKVTTSAADLAKSSVTAEIIGDEKGPLLDAAVRAVAQRDEEGSENPLAEARRKLEEAKSDRVMGELDRLLGNEPRKP